LLTVLDHPDTPLHTNGSENDIRCEVTKPQSAVELAATWAATAAMPYLGLAKTCAKLGIAFWDYLGSRLAVPDHPTVPSLADLVRCRGQPA
jgi:hypothetical protein